ncbi:MAG: ATP-binding protein [Desulfuromonadaceae bacterium]|nr:ATP-binding protein [Desulfuromonadaceae bacterium]
MNIASERRLRLFIYARIVVSSLFLAATLLLEFQDSLVKIERFQPGVVKLMAFSFLFSLISLIPLEKHKFIQSLTYLQVIWDLSFVTVLILFTGGILSPYSFLYLLLIMIAGMLLGRRQALYTASLCGILYGTILDFQYFGYLSYIGLSQEDAYQVGSLRLLYTISFNLIAFGLTAFITGLLTERARLSEEALQRSSINYYELAQLNTSIVACSDSGILTTTVTGRIRVFNPYAESIVGLSQSAVYDMKIESIFPTLSGPDYSRDTATNREFEYRSPDGQVMTIGYRIDSFNDGTGVLAGYIMNFRDITNIRRMESALKKADRLAAVGELSARMAHEIRNPLAALCGAVQLLASSAQFHDNDVPLLAIVTREAERLNELISEFLLYARPAPPHREKIELLQYIEGIVLFMSQDPRFTYILIKNNITKPIEILADSNQLYQVLLNLLQNAAEAMPSGGEILIESHHTTYSTVTISITDTGSGIADDNIQHIFEPFWTTKPAGTGLGLAICYRIIEAQGGSLTVTSPASGGCRFDITLPAG